MIILLCILVLTYVIVGSILMELGNFIPMFIQIPLLLTCMASFICMIICIVCLIAGNIFDDEDSKKVTDKFDNFFSKK